MLSGNYRQHKVIRQSRCPSRDILRAAAKLATTKGLDGLSVGDLAAEVGMSKVSSGDSNAAASGRNWAAGVCDVLIFVKGITVRKRTAFR